MNSNTRETSIPERTLAAAGRARIRALVAAEHTAEPHEVVGTLREVFWTLIDDKPVYIGTLETPDTNHTVVAYGDLIEQIRTAFRDGTVLRMLLRPADGDRTMGIPVTFEDLSGKPEADGLRMREVAPIFVIRIARVMAAAEKRGTTLTGTLADVFCTEVENQVIYAGTLLIENGQRKVFVRGSCLERIRGQFRNGETLTAVLHYVQGDPDMMEIVDVETDTTEPERGFAPGLSLVVMTEGMRPGHLIALVRHAPESGFYESSDAIAAMNAAAMRTAVESFAPSAVFERRATALRGRPIRSVGPQQQAMALARHYALVDPDTRAAMRRAVSEPMTPFVPFILNPEAIRTLIDHVALTLPKESDGTVVGMGRLAESLATHLGATTFLAVR